MDKELSLYEKLYLNPDIEKTLITKNELLASFAISKAEYSQLSIAEAKGVYKLILSDPSYNFIHQKIHSRNKLTQKDYERLEFFNIAKTFRRLNQEKFSINALTPVFIKILHEDLTKGLDMFSTTIPDFTLYKSGQWRDNNLIRVGDYVPSSCAEIKTLIQDLILWIKRNQTPTGIAVFHTLLYAIHPFNNGNKRVCRILEHLMLRSIRLNTNNLYSTSYYYHKQKARYYKYLLVSLERKNCQFFVNFVFEALALSIIDVVKLSLEVKRKEFIDTYKAQGQVDIVLKPFIKRREIQFKTLARITKGKIARQTLVTYLSKAVEQKILTKREQGRTTYYTLNFQPLETETLSKWIDFAKKHLSYIPDDLLLA